MTDQPDPWRLDQRQQSILTKAAQELLRRLSLGRARCYRALFLSGLASPQDRDVVLADLRDFCRADETTFSADPATAARYAGRREVWLRLSQHLSLTDDQVRRLQPLEVDDGLR